MRALIQPDRVPISATAISATNTIRPIQRMDFGAKPPPRKATGRGSDMLQLRIRRAGLFSHQVPEMALWAFQIGVAEGAL